MLLDLSSPIDFLASYFSAGEPQGELLLVSGPSASGKTRWCLELAEVARAHAVPACGLISLPVFQSGRKVAIDLLELGSQERRRLATARQQSDRPTSLSTESWQFDPATLAWGNAILAAIHDCPLLIIDELGPLELSRGAGWQSGLRLVSERNYGLAVVVVRPSLLPAALARWPWAQVLTLPAGTGEVTA